jgi:group II intron reverse transcriptase/maturase
MKHELLNNVLHPVNLTKAMRKVIANKGSAGIDNMKVTDLADYMRQHRAEIISSIERGTYQPQLVKGVEVEKLSGGKRLLGIPTVVDRTIQQAIQQELSVIFEPEFSDYSYAFRPSRGAQKALRQALEYINNGYQEIIDLDLKSFFDLVNHDVLMNLLYRKVKDVKLLRLIRKFLKTGILLGGVELEREEGTPQGSPLSPLLSNIILNELDKELSRRGLRFVRYADDVSIFLKSRKAAQRVLKNITKFIEQKLHLKVNSEKTSICRPVNFHLLGYNFISTYQAGVKGKYRLRVSPKRFEIMKQKVKEITRKTRSISFTERIGILNSYLKGWIGYYRYAHMYEKLSDLDTWIRSRLRYCIWKAWKKPNKRMRSYIQMDIPPDMAYAWSRSRMGGWAQALSPMMKTTVTNERLKRKGYIEFSKYYAERFYSQLNPPIKF